MMNALLQETLNSSCSQELFTCHMAIYNMAKAQSGIFGKETADAFYRGAISILEFISNQDDEVVSTFIKMYKNENAIAALKNK